MTGSFASNIILKDLDTQRHVQQRAHPSICTLLTVDYSVSFTVFSSPSIGVYGGQSMYFGAFPEHSLVAWDKEGPGPDREEEEVAEWLAHENGSLESQV